jgi:hypothetical protein
MRESTEELLNFNGKELPVVADMTHRELISPG